MGVAAPMFLAGVASVWFITRQRSAAWFLAVGLLAATLVGAGVLLWGGIEMRDATRNRGGDYWAAYTEFVSTLLGIACPGVVGVITLVSAGSLWIVRKKPKV
jgi:hypothetical protein